MQNTNYVVATPNSTIGYIDESTPCGKAKARQVKADLEQLAIMQNDSNLTANTKKAIVTDYMKSIRDYVMKEETCCCHSECECDCEEEEWEEEEYEEEELTIEDMECYSIYFVESEEIHCDSYAETIEKIEALLTLGIEPIAYGYDSQGDKYALDIIEGSAGLYLRIA
jgi:hypothetical protein